MTTKLELFTSPSAFPNPQRLRLFMHEKGIADQFDERIYDMTPVGEQRQWKHLKMNPWGETLTLQLADGNTSSPRPLRSSAISTRPSPAAVGHGQDAARSRAWTTMWDNRVWVHILYRIVTAVPRSAPGARPEARADRQRTPGVSIAARRRWRTPALVDRHLSDGRDWLLGGDEPTFSDITMATAIAFSKFPVIATPLDERFEHVDAYWRRWRQRPSFMAAYADRNSGVPEVDKPA